MTRQKMTKKTRGLLPLLSVIFILGCAKTGPVQTVELDSTLEHGRPLNIVTTFPPLYAHVANLADENDSITNLIAPGTSVHFRQPTPQAVRTMQNADIIITNGLHLEEFLEKYLKDLASRGVVVLYTSLGVELLNFGATEDEEEHHEEDAEEHHEHEGADPHIWLDPQNAIIQVQNIQQALSELDTGQALYYDGASKAYISKISELDQDIKSKFASADINSFAVFHNAYQYFLHAYGIADKQVAVIKNLDADQPSQKEISDLLYNLSTHNTKIIFTEPQFSPNLAQTLAEQANIQTASIDPIGTFLDKDAYLVMMKNLADTFISMLAYD